MIVEQQITGYNYLILNIESIGDCLEQINEYLKIYSDALLLFIFYLLWTAISQNQESVSLQTLLFYIH